jgi:hypothetical protein
MSATRSAIRHGLSNCKTKDSQSLCSDSIRSPGFSHVDDANGLALDDVKAVLFKKSDDKDAATRKKGLAK